MFARPRVLTVAQVHDYRSVPQGEPTVVFTPPPWSHLSVFYVCFPYGALSAFKDYRCGVLRYSKFKELGVACSLLNGMM